jgi:hypothetical protein
MQIEFRLEGDAVERIRDLAGEPVDLARQTLSEQALRAALTQIVASNPVETGRSRGAWVESLEQLGGTPAAGWEGSQPTAVEEGRRQGQLLSQQLSGRTVLSAVNGVSYVRYLEYGTSRMAPFAMVRRSLRSLVPRLGDWFRLRSTPR